MSMEMWTLFGLVVGAVSLCFNLVQFLLGLHHRRLFRAKVQELYRSLVSPVWYAKHLIASTRALAKEPGEITSSDIRKINIHAGQLQGVAISTVLGLQGFGERYLSLPLPPWQQVIEELESRGDLAAVEE